MVGRAPVVARSRDEYHAGLIANRRVNGARNGAGAVRRAANGADIHEHYNRHVKLFGFVDNELDRNWDQAGIVENGNRGCVAVRRGSVVHKFHGNYGRLRRDAVILVNIAAVARCNGGVGRPVAQVIALWYGSAALERLVDLSLSVESAYALRIVRRVGAGAVGQVEDIGDAGGAVGITKIVVLPIDPAVDP
jgi:hypothetical protein